MKNIPMFTTDNGVASLILEEIPYKKLAYVRVHTSTSPQLLLDEAISFCRAVGAEKILATGATCFEVYPKYSQIVRMQCKTSVLEKSNLKLCLVTAATLPRWCDIYNSRMSEVPNAATMNGVNSSKLLSEGDCYFVYDDTCLVGIGKITNSSVDVIASVVRGKGEAILRALCCAINAEYVTVDVAVNNYSAFSLYKRMGFEEIETLSTWYCVYNR